MSGISARRQPTVVSRASASRFAAEFERAFAAGVPDGVVAPEVVTLADLSIRDKSRRIIPFTPNAVQTSYLDMLAEDYGLRWRDGVWAVRGVRDDILKARQEGMSTLLLALIFLDTINTPNTYSLIVAHDADSVQLLFRVIDRYYSFLPEAKRRPVRYSTRTELTFADTGSTIQVSQAGSRGIARALTYNNVLLTERAHWPVTDRLRENLDSGIIGTLPPDANLWIETTANGLNFYYDERNRYREDEQGAFKLRFFPWWRHEEYRATPPDRFERTVDEEARAALYGLDDAQLYWYRRTASQIPLMKQEHPDNEEEAFRATATASVFDVEYLLRLLAQVRSEGPPLRVVQAGRRIVPRVDYVQPDEEPLGSDLSIWREPSPEHRYIVTADPAEGLTKQAKPDYSVMDVWDATTWEQVAHYRTKDVDTTQFGLDCVRVARYYNNAELMVERNNHGHAVILSATQLGLYTNMFVERGAGKSALGVPLDKFGYQSDVRSKRTSVAMAVGIVNDMASGAAGLVLHAEQTVREMIAFIRTPTGFEAQGTDNDDCVTSVRMFAARVFSETSPLETYDVRPRSPAVLYSS